MMLTEDENPIAMFDGEKVKKMCSRYGITWKSGKMMHFVPQHRSLRVPSDSCDSSEWIRKNLVVLQLELNVSR